jgi:hypothetical protein
MHACLQTYYVWLHACGITDVCCLSCAPARPMYCCPEGMHRQLTCVSERLAEEDAHKDPQHATLGFCDIPVTAATRT